MPKITDPDLLNQGTEITINTADRTVELSIAGNLSTDGLRMQTLYSFLKEEWKNDSELIKYPFPMISITDEQFEFISDWKPIDVNTTNLFRDGGFACVSTAGVMLEQYIGFITLGSIGASDQIYYQQVQNGVATNVVLTGASNQCIKVFGNADNGNFDLRTYFKCFVREQSKLYDESDLLAIGTVDVTYQVYRFPLANSDDTKVTHTDVEVQAAPYTNIDVTYHSTAQSRTIGGVAY